MEIMQYAFCREIFFFLTHLQSSAFHGTFESFDRILLGVYINGQIDNLNPKISLKYQIQKIVLVATLKLSVATFGDWRKGWTTLY